MKVYIATKNPKKIEITKKVFTNYFPKEDNLEILTSEASSDISGTPQGNVSFLGAKNRAINSKNMYSDGDYFVGIETGLFERDGYVFEETWSVIITKSDKTGISYASCNYIDVNTKKRYSDISGNRILQIFDDINKEWREYSGNTEKREIEIENSLRSSLLQIM